MGNHCRIGWVPGLEVHRPSITLGQSTKLPNHDKRPLTESIKKEFQSKTLPSQKGESRHGELRNNFSNAADIPTERHKVIIRLPSQYLMD